MARTDGQLHLFGRRSFPDRRPAYRLAPLAQQPLCERSALDKAVSILVRNGNFVILEEANSSIADRRVGHQTEPVARVSVEEAVLQEL
jgi:hypothetical protein